MFGSIQDDSSDVELPDTLFKMMSKASGGGYEAFFNETVMANAAREAYQNIAVQIANKHVVLPSGQTFKGEQVYLENRLHVRDIAMWLMFGGFIMMALLSGAVILTRPRDVVPRNPEPIGSIALILARSKPLQTILHNAGALPANSLRALLFSSRFQTRSEATSDATRTFRIEPLGSDRKEPIPTTKSYQVKRWRPLPMKLPVFILMLCLPLVIIVILEVLQHLSGRNHGFVSSPNDRGYALDVYARYLPALVMLLIATMYNSMDFTASSLAPFSALRAGNAPAKKSILSSLLGKDLLHAAYIAITSRHWSPVFSMTSALIGSVLTIIVSGLYTIEYVPRTQTVELRQSDVFNISWANSNTRDNSAAVLTSLVESENLTYPQFTYGELALPRVRIDSPLPGNNDSSQLSLNAQLPALRASLNCTISTTSSYSVSAAHDPGTSQFLAKVKASAPIPHDCIPRDRGGNSSIIEWTNTFRMVKAGYIGLLGDLHPGNSTNTGDALTFSSDFSSLPVGCPTLIFTFGYVRLHQISKSNVTTMLCYQLMEEIQTNVTFTLPDFSISTSPSPIPNENTAQYLPSNSSGSTAFNYRLETNLLNELALFNQDAYGSNSGSNSPVDPFFQGVLFGKQSIHPSELVGASNHPKLLHAIQSFYRRYMAQAISANMRIIPSATPGKTPPPDPIPATLTNPNSPRLKQNNASKITLQALLGIMVLCGAAAYFLHSTRHLLPHEPYSIAGAASLFAGSKMCAGNMKNGIPEGAEWMSDKELRRSKVWEGWLFSLGWWDGGATEGRRFGVDVGRAERS